MELEQGKSKLEDVLRNAHAHANAHAHNTHSKGGGNVSDVTRGPESDVCVEGGSKNEKV